MSATADRAPATVNMLSATADSMSIVPDLVLPRGICAAPDFNQNGAENCGQ